MARRGRVFLSGVDAYEHNPPIMKESEFVMRFPYLTTALLVSTEYKPKVTEAITASKMLSGRLRYSVLPKFCSVRMIIMRPKIPSSKKTNCSRFNPSFNINLAKRVTNRDYGYDNSRERPAIEYR